MCLNAANVNVIYTNGQAYKVCIILPLYRTRRRHRQLAGASLDVSCHAECLLQVSCGPALLLRLMGAVCQCVCRSLFFCLLVFPKLWLSLKLPAEGREGHNK